MMKVSSSTDNNQSDAALQKLNALLDRKETIQARLNEASMEYRNSCEEVERLEIALREIQERMQQVPDNERYSDKRQGLTDAIRLAKSEFDDARARCCKIEGEINHLQTVELPACMAGLDAGAVLEHYRQLVNAKAEVARIQAVIDDKNQFIAKARATIPKEIDRKHERSSLMAETALGKDMKAELNRIDGEIAANQQQIAAATEQVKPAIDDAQSTLEGLEKMLISAQSAVSVLAEKSKEIAYRYHFGKAEALAEQYAFHAIKLRETYFQLLGMDRIIKQHDGKGILRSTYKPIQIPKLAMPQCDKVASFPPNEESSILDEFFIRFSDEVEKAASAALAEFNALTVV